MSYLRRWSDFIMATGSLVFSVSLIPTVWANMPPPLLTTVPHTFMLYLMSATFLSLGMKRAGATLFGNATLWLILALQGVY